MEQDIHWQAAFSGASEVESVPHAADEPPPMPSPRSTGRRRSATAGDAEEAMAPAEAGSGSSRVTRTTSNGADTELAQGHGGRGGGLWRTRSRSGSDPRSRATRTDAEYRHLPYSRDKRSVNADDPEDKIQITLPPELSHSSSLLEISAIRQLQQERAKEQSAANKDNVSRATHDGGAEDDDAIPQAVASQQRQEQQLQTPPATKHNRVLDMDVRQDIAATQDGTEVSLGSTVRHPSFSDEHKLMAAPVHAHDDHPLDSDHGAVGPGGKADLEYDRGEDHSGALAAHARQVTATRQWAKAARARVAAARAKERGIGGKPHISDGESGGDELNDGSDMDLHGPRRSSWDVELGGISRAHFSFNSLKRFFRTHGRSTVFLICLGFLVASVDYAIDEGIRGLSAFRSFLTTLAAGVYMWQLAVFVLFVISSACLAAYITKRLDPAAAGSGIPEMKYILAGDVHGESGKYLNERIMVAKVFGLTLSAGSGLAVGREGPFVHTANIIAHLLLKHTPYFESLHLSGTLKRQIYAAACAVGVSSTFASPIGGVLFSIEVTSTYYLVSNYWKGFLVALAGSVVVKLANTIRFSESTAEKPFFPVNLKLSAYRYSELPIMMALGLCLGLFAIILLKGHMACKKFIGKYRKEHPLLVTAIASAIVGTVFFVSGRFNRTNMFVMVQDVLSENRLPTRWRRDGYNEFGSLAVFAVTRVFMTYLSTNLPLPAGDFIPLFVIGAALGRLFGETLDWIFPAFGFTPAGYALCGAAALTSAATHTISAAVITLEVTGEFDYHLPVLLTVMVALAVSRVFSDSIYDLSMQYKNLHVLPLLKGDSVMEHISRDVMDTDLKLMTQESKYNDILELLQKTTFSAFPVVTTREDMVFLGCVSRKSLVDHMTKHFYELNMLTRLGDVLPNDVNVDSNVRNMRKLQRRNTVADVWGKLGYISKNLTFRTDTQYWRDQNAHSHSTNDSVNSNNNSLDRPPSESRGRRPVWQVFGEEQSGPSGTDIAISDADAAKGLSPFGSPHGLDGGLSGHANTPVGSRGGAVEMKDIHSSHVQQQQQERQQHQHHGGGRDLVVRTHTADEVILGTTHTQTESPPTRPHAAPTHTPPTNGSASGSAGRYGRTGHSPATSTARWYRALEMSINLSTCNDIRIDPSPFRVSEFMPLEQVYMLFEMLRCSRVFVTSFGVLSGVISRSILMEYLANPDKAM